MLLLASGILAAGISVAAIIWAMHAAARVRPLAQRGLASLAARLQRRESVGRLIDRAATCVPSAYLGLHLTLGLVVALVKPGP